MGRAAKKERGSCLFLEHKQCMESDKMCNACYELYRYGGTNSRRFDLKNTGVCFCKHPDSKENWLPHDKAAKFWGGRLVQMFDDDAKTYTTEIDASLYPTAHPTAAAAAAAATNDDRPKRNRSSTNHFVAEPSKATKMNCHCQISLSRRRKKNKRTHCNIDSKKQDILSRISLLPTQEMNSMISPVITMAQKTRDGRVAFAKKLRKVGGNEGPMRLSTNGTSSTAVSLYSKTYQEASIGLATMLDPSDPRAAFTLLKSARTPLTYRNNSNSCQQEVVETVRKLGTIPEERQ